MKHSTSFRHIGASAHTEKDRNKFDYYATDPRAIDDLFNRESFSNKIWEPACGEGHLSKRISELNPDTGIYSSDIVDRGFGDVRDFLSIDNMDWQGDIITNPPYKYSQDFIEKSLRIIPKENKVAMFLKIQFLEGKRRKQFFLMHPPKNIYVYSFRINCAMNGDFVKYSKNCAICYAWYVWEKGNKDKPTLDWI